MTAHTISKTLSANDVGDTGAHQAGMHIPKQEEILSFFPALDTATKNPRCIMNFVDDADSTWKFAFIYYNNKFFGGTRNEYRLTRMTPFINEHQLRAGDQIFLVHLDNGEWRIRLKRYRRSARADDGVLRLGSNWKVISI